MFGESTCYYAGSRADSSEYTLVFNVVKAGGSYSVFTFYSHIRETFNLYDKTYKVLNMNGDTITLEVE